MLPRYKCPSKRLVSGLLAAVTAALALGIAACGSNATPGPNPTPSIGEVKVGQIYELDTGEQSDARYLNTIPREAQITTDALGSDGFVPTGKVQVASPAGEWHIVFTHCPHERPQDLVPLDRAHRCNQDAGVDRPPFATPRIERLITVTTSGGRVAFGSYVRQQEKGDHPNYPYPFRLFTGGNNGKRVVSANCLSLLQPYNRGIKANEPGMAAKMVAVSQDPHHSRPGTYYGPRKKSSGRPTFSCDIS